MTKNVPCFGCHSVDLKLTFDIFKIKKQKQKQKKQSIKINFVNYILSLSPDQKRKVLKKKFESLENKNK